MTPFLLYPQLDSSYSLSPTQSSRIFIYVMSSTGIVVIVKFRFTRVLTELIEISFLQRLLHTYVTSLIPNFH